MAFRPRGGREKNGICTLQKNIVTATCVVGNIWDPLGLDHDPRSASDAIPMERNSPDACSTPRTPWLGLAWTQCAELPRRHGPTMNDRCGGSSRSR
jgi:hypothetical protein